MEDKYGMMDLITHYMNGGPIFPAIPDHQQPPHDLHYPMVMLGGGGGGFGSDSTMGMGSTSGVSGDSSGGGGGGGSGGGRWPKEETLVLLEIRSRLDSKFKEATHKGPLWDEVSRIMCMEHGYKRTGKKCSEKFENLYKYYKKIKEGKAGRQDKKHYRFFHQLDAIYGKTMANNTSHDPNPQLVINNPSIFDPSSHDFQNRLPPFIEDHSNCVEKMINKKITGKKRWKTMITDFIETRVNTLMERQDKWMEKMMKTIDEKEKERILKEEQWRKEEVARLEIATKLRANERAWIESRDSVLMEALHKLTANESSANVASCSENYNDWEENEITQLIQLRCSMETRFEQGVCLEEVLWEEIASRMACLGYNKNAFMCKGKWDHINLLLKTKKRKENTISCSNLYPDHEHHNYIFHQEEEIMWNGYEMKMSKGENI